MHKEETRLFKGFTLYMYHVKRLVFTEIENFHVYFETLGTLLLLWTKFLVVN